MLQQDRPEDYVLATNETHTVREFVEVAFAEVGVSLRWEGHGVDEKGYDTKTGVLRVDIDEQFFRPAEVELLWGDASKAERDLGWKRKTGFQELVTMMVRSDLEHADR